jgi:hypothetical protein
VQYIQEVFPDVLMESVSWKYWNDTVGVHDNFHGPNRDSNFHHKALSSLSCSWLMMKNMLPPSSLCQISDCPFLSLEGGAPLTGKPSSFAQCAAAALFKYVQTKLSTIYSPRSLRIHYQVVEGKLYPHMSQMAVST